jgi:hypothetical protein
MVSLLKSFTASPQQMQGYCAYPVFSKKLNRFNRTDAILAKSKGRNGSATIFATSENLVLRIMRFIRPFFVLWKV